jgi:hypothetical protein
MPDFAKLLDKAKELLGQHPEQANEGMEKAGDFADKETGGRYGDQSQQGQQGQQGQDQGGQGNQ